MIEYLITKLDRFIMFIANLPHNRFNRLRYRYSVLDLICKEATKESVKYICENGSNSVMFGYRKQLFKFVFCEYIKNSEYKDKLFLEFGTYKGESINFCSSLIPEAKFYGFDSFEGLPETSGIWAKGNFDVKEKLPKVNKNVSF